MDSDVKGHYTCDPQTGEKVCQPGYTDPASNCITGMHYNLACVRSTHKSCEQAHDHQVRRVTSGLYFSLYMSHVPISGRSVG